MDGRSLREQKNVSSMLRVKQNPAESATPFSFKAQRNILLFLTYLNFLKK
jgi:hypothetical protein